MWFLELLKWLFGSTERDADVSDEEEATLEWEEDEEDEEDEESGPLD